MIENKINEFGTKDHFSLWDAAVFLSKSWRWWVVGMLVGFSISGSYLLITPSQYEATVVIQPATVGTVNGGTITPFTFEPPEKTLERLKLVPFYGDSLVESCGSGTSQSLAARIKASVVKNNSLLQISYRAGSPEQASACVTALVTNIVQIQTETAKGLIKTIEEQRKLVQDQLLEAERFQERIEKRAVSASGNDLASSLLIFNALSKSEDIAFLRNKLISLRTRLSEPLTQPAKILEPVYAPNNVVYPIKSLVILSGVMGGAISGVVLFAFVWFLRQSSLVRR